MTISNEIDTFGQVTTSIVVRNQIDPHIVELPVAMSDVKV